MLLRIVKFLLVLILLFCNAQALATNTPNWELNFNWGAGKNKDFSLEEAQFFIPELNQTLTHIRINVHWLPHQVQYEGKGWLGSEQVTIHGSTDLTQAGNPSVFHIKGEHLLIINTREYQIYASPDLTLSIHGKKVFVSGTIVIPQAQIQPQDFRNSVRLPEEDIVYTNIAPNQRSAWQVTARILVKTGDDVAVNTMGIQGKISGQLEILKQPGQTTLATGRIFIRNGVYDADGSLLVLTPSSHIQFTQSPITNPNLNLRASKSITINNKEFPEQNITVGFDIDGNFRSPKITPFSIPATLSKADILSYLMMGTESSPQASGNYSLALRALNSASTKTNNRKRGLIDEIKHTLGLSELGIESKTTKDAIGNPIDRQTAFVLGRNISKRIYVRYSQGIRGYGLTDINEFSVRYLLNRNWAIQTNKNTNGSGIDLLYTLEKDNLLPWNASNTRHEKN